MAPYNHSIRLMKHHHDVAVCSLQHVGGETKPNVGCVFRHFAFIWKYSTTITIFSYYRKNREHMACLFEAKWVFLRVASKWLYLKTGDVRGRIFPHYNNKSRASLPPLRQSPPRRFFRQKSYDSVVWLLRTGAQGRRRNERILRNSSNVYP